MKSSERRYEKRAWEQGGEPKINKENVATETMNNALKSLNCED